MIKFIILKKEEAFFIVEHIALRATAEIEIPEVNTEQGTMDGETPWPPEDYEYEFITKIGDDPVEIMICGEDVFNYFMEELRSRQ